MDLKTKRKTKRLMYILQYIGYASFVVFILNIVLMGLEIIPLDYVRKNSFNGAMMAIALILLPLIAFIVLHIASMTYSYRLTMHKAKVNEYRRRFLFKKVMQAAAEKKFKEAISLYNHMPNKSILKDYAYMHLITVFKYSDAVDEKNHIQGLERLKILIDSYNPEDVFKEK